MKEPTLTECAAALVRTRPTQARVGIGSLYNLLVILKRQGSGALRHSRVLTVVAPGVGKRG